MRTISTPTLFIGAKVAIVSPYPGSSGGTITTGRIVRLGRCAVTGNTVAAVRLHNGAYIQQIDSAFLARL